MAAINNNNPCDTLSFSPSFMGTVENDLPIQVRILTVAKQIPTTESSSAASAATTSYAEGSRSVTPAPSATFAHRESEVEEEPEVPSLGLRRKFQKINVDISLQHIPYPVVYGKHETREEYFDGPTHRHAGKIVPQYRP